MDGWRDRRIHKQAKNYTDQQDKYGLFYAPYYFTLYPYPVYLLDFTLYPYPVYLLDFTLLIKIKSPRLNQSDKIKENCCKNTRS